MENVKEIDVVYSPICEATGAMLGTLRQWLDGTGIKINLYPFQLCPDKLKSRLTVGENCFFEVFYNGIQIDTVPLHRDKLCKALGIPQLSEQTYAEEIRGNILTESELSALLKDGKITFLPITRDNYNEEMSMCLCNYPFGNPPKQFRNACIEIKSKVFSEVWGFESIAGIYAKYNGNVIGLLEVMPREIIGKYGFMTGTLGTDGEYLSIGCYEVGYGIPRIAMLDALMIHLKSNFHLFHRKYLEGIGVKGCNDGFNPYWVYQKHGFTESEKLAANTYVMKTKIQEKGKIRLS